MQARASRHRKTKTAHPHSECWQPSQDGEIQTQRSTIQKGLSERYSRCWSQCLEEEGQLPHGRGGTTWRLGVSQLVALLGPELAQEAGAGLQQGPARRPTDKNFRGWGKSGTVAGRRGVLAHSILPGWSLATPQNSLSRAFFFMPLSKRQKSDQSSFRASHYRKSRRH